MNDAFVCLWTDHWDFCGWLALRHGYWGLKAARV